MLAQSDLGARLFSALNLAARDFETNIVIVDRVIYTRLDAFAAAMAALPGPWRALRIVGWLPKWIKHPVYSMIARNRYRLWGKQKACLMPSEGARKRFLGSVVLQESS